MDYPIFYDKNETDFTTLGVVAESAWDVCIREVINGEYTLTFSMRRDSPAWEMAVYDNLVLCAGQLFRVRGTSEGREQDGSLTGTVSCVHVWYEAADCKYIPHCYTQSGDEQIDGWIDKSPQWILEQAFAGTQFTVGEVELTAHTDLFASKTNPAAIAAQLAEQMEGELMRDRYTVGLVKQQGNNNGVQIRYGKNLRTVHREIDDTAVVTRLYPYGQDDLDISTVNGGQTYIDSPLAGQYGYAKCGTVSYADVTDPAELLEKAQKEWSNAERDGLDKPHVTYTVEATALTGIGLGDRVRVIDEDLGLDVSARVVELEWFPYEPQRGQVKLSNYKIGKGSLAEQVTQQAAQLDKITDQNGNVMSQYLDNVRGKLQSEVEENIRKRLTVHEFGDIWVDDLANPRKAMVISDGIFAVANSKKANGDWDWRTIGTADEFMADTINADWINAGYINTSCIDIRSDDGSAKLSGNAFTITTPEGFSAQMSGEDGFTYIYKRDESGNPYDYVQLDHRGQRRYWHGAMIPSTYQFAKGQVVCEYDSYRDFAYGLVQLRGAAWQEIARQYNAIANDAALSTAEKVELMQAMLQWNVTPIRLLGMAEQGAVVLNNEFLTVSVGSWELPELIEISSAGTKVQTYRQNATNYSETFYYDGAMMRYFGNGGYVRGPGQADNQCLSVEAGYDLAVTLDVEYQME